MSSTTSGINTKEMIGKRLANIRKARGLTQQELRAKMGVSQETVAKWETGEREIKGSYLSELSHHLEVTCDEIINGVKAENVDIHAKTGLSDKAIMQLDGTIGSFADETGYDRNTEARKFLNALLENERFDRLVLDFHNLEEAKTSNTETSRRNYVASRAKQGIENGGIVPRNPGNLDPDAYETFCKYNCAEEFRKILDDYLEVIQHANKTSE